MSLLSLPLELQQHIADGLEPSSLRNFDLTSIACHKASLPAIFRRIFITVYDPEGLQRDTKAPYEALSYSNSFPYIRHITIKGALRGKEIERSIERWPKLSVWALTLDTVNLLLDETPINYTGMYAVLDSNVIEALSEADLARWIYRVQYWSITGSL
jgi:hypothetical protein